MSQVQMAAVSIVPTILDYLDDGVIRNQLLPRARMVHTTNVADVKIVLSLLACIAKVGGNLKSSIQLVMAWVLNVKARFSQDFF